MTFGCYLIPFVLKNNFSDTATKAICYLIVSAVNRTVSDRKSKSRVSRKPLRGEEIAVMRVHACP